MDRSQGFIETGIYYAPERFSRENPFALYRDVHTEGNHVSVLRVPSNSLRTINLLNFSRLDNYLIRLINRLE